MTSGAVRTTTIDSVATSYTNTSPTSGISSSRQAHCQVRFQTFSSSSCAYSREVYLWIGTSSGPEVSGDTCRRNPGTARESLLSSAWYQ